MFRNLSAVTVADLVLTKDINLRAIQHFYDAIRKKFFNSDEYDWRKYRFRDRQEYLAWRNKAGEVISGDE